MSVLYLVVPYARMDCYLLNLLRCSGGNAGRVIRAVIMANGEAIPLYTKILYPSHLSVPFYSILFVCVAFGIFYLSLAPFQGCRGCRRFLRQPLPSVSPKHRRNRAWLVPQF